MGKLVDRTGVVYGRLVVVGRDESFGPASKGNRVRWLCRCECGNTKSVTGHELAAGQTQSCGCIHIESVGALNRSHAMSRSRTYRTWQAMKSRCNNPKDTRYPNYGARGVRVCREWDSFEQFFKDMGLRPEGMTIDRIRNEDGYQPDNCRWANTEVQGNNKRTNVIWEGESLSVKQLSDKVGVPRTTLNALIRSGLSVPTAVEHAIRKRRHRN